MGKSILFVSHSSSLTGGGENDFIRLLKFFHTKYEITGIFPEGKNISEYKKYVKEYLIIPNIMLPFYKFNFISYILFILNSILKKRKKIKNFLRNRNFDLVYIHSSVCYFEFLLLKARYSKIIVTIREIINPKFLQKLIYKDYLKNMTCIICISNYVKDTFSLYGKSEKLIVIPCAIEKINFSSVNVNINTAIKVFLIIGNVHPLKDQLTAIKAFHKLDDSMISLHIIGSITDTKYYNSLIKNYSNLIDSGRVKFLGELKRDIVLKKINESFAVIIPSEYEGFSLVYLEASQLGKPVITTPVGIMKEIVKNEENGLLFEPKNYNILSEKIRRLLDNNSLYNKISLNAPLYINNFSIDKVMSDYEYIFEKVIHEN